MVPRHRLRRSVTMHDVESCRASTLRRDSNGTAPRMRLCPRAAMAWLRRVVDTCLGVGERPSCESDYIGSVLRVGEGSNLGHCILTQGE